MAGGITNNRISSFNKLGRYVAAGFMTSVNEHTLRYRLFDRLATKPSMGT